MAISTEEQIPVAVDPLVVATRLRPTVARGLASRFAPSDPDPALELTANKRVARLLSTKFQFLLILPNQIVFWTVILVGFLGTVVPGLDFGTAITWYVWFCLVVMMVVVGRASCAMCPFGGFAEWIQRRSFFKRTQKTLGLGLKFPEPLARLGFVLPVGSFLSSTGSRSSSTSPARVAPPTRASWSSASSPRRSCSSSCSSAGPSVATSAPSRASSARSARSVRWPDSAPRTARCASAARRRMHPRGESGYGCPWYTWPGSADSNLYCGLCTECFKSCPEGNVGLFVQKPLTSVVAPPAASRRGMGDRHAVGTRRLPAVQRHERLRRGGRMAEHQPALPPLPQPGRLPRLHRRRGARDRSRCCPGHSPAGRSPSRNPETSSTASPVSGPSSCPSPTG